MSGGGGGGCSSSGSGDGSGDGGGGGGGGGRRGNVLAASVTRVTISWVGHSGGGCCGCRCRRRVVFACPWLVLAAAARQVLARAAGWLLGAGNVAVSSLLLELPGRTPQAVAVFGR